MFLKLFPSFLFLRRMRIFEFTNSLAHAPTYERYDDKHCEKS